MARTETIIKFGLFALEIKQDSALSSPVSLQPFSRLSDLRTDSTTARPYASFEPDFWLLDGQYKFLPSDYTTVHVGLMSLAQSDANGDFSTPPVLTITFSVPHSSDGLALTFSTYTGDYSDDIDVAYYDATDTLIRTDNYNPTSAEFSTGQAVNDFKKIVITFNSTNRPYRYLRVRGIDYGELYSFEGTAVRECTVIEQVNQLSTEVPFGQMDLTLYSDDAEFSIINPQGEFSALTERLPLSVYEKVDYATLFIGNFYLDEWENVSDTEYIFHAIDILGILDRTTYNGGIWTSGIAIEDLIEDILQPISVPYELDADLVGTVLTGWLPIGSYREALQQIAFAAGAFVTCARSGAIRILKTRIASDSASEASITKAEKGSDQKLTLRPLVTGVELTSHDYAYSTTSDELFNGTLTEGEHEIQFGDPRHDLSVTGATITESGVNYAILTVAATGTVVLTGQRYIDTAIPHRWTNPSISATTRPNVIKIDKATLINNDAAAIVLERVSDYYLQRYKQTCKLYAPFIEPAQVVTVDTLYNSQLRAVIERMDLDLARGFQANVEMVGVINE